MHPICALPNLYKLKVLYLYFEVGIWVLINPKILIMASMYQNNQGALNFREILQAIEFITNSKKFVEIC